MQKKVQPGKTIEYTAGSAVAAGDPVLIGVVFAVAVANIAASEMGACEVEGVFSLPKATGAITQGDQLYWDADGDPVGGTAGTGALTTSDDSGANSPVGKAWDAAASDDETVNIKINA